MITNLISLLPSNISITDNGVGNIIDIDENIQNCPGSVRLVINGDNNKIYIPQIDRIQGNLYINVFANNSVVSMNRIYVGKSLKIVLGSDFFVDKKAENMSVVVGDNFFVESATIQNFHSGTSLSIGENCMFSDGIWISNSDHHPIYDENHNIINKASNLEIGNHVWVGYKSFVLKSVKIADGCIIGAGSVVSKSCIKSNSVYAGNPAVCKKQNVFWDFRDKKFI